MNRPRPVRPLLAAACVAALVLAAVVVRGGTAVDGAEVAAVQTSLDPAPTVTDVPAAPPLPEGALLVRPDGVAGLRLGMATAEVAAAGFAVQAPQVGGCRRVVAGAASPVPAAGVSGWLVDDEVVAVAVDARAGRGSSFLGAGLGGRLQDLPSGEGLRRSTRTVAVPWQAAPVTVALVQVAPAAGVRVTFTDLSGAGQIDHVQVLGDAGAGCGPTAAARAAALSVSLPPLEPDGRAGARVGRTLDAVRREVSLEPAVPAAQVGRPCRLVLADGEPGLVYLVVSPDDAGRDVVRAVAVDAGSTSAGLRVGDPAERAAALHPGITTAFLQERWEQGLIADWQDEAGTLRLAPAREQVVLPDLDAVLQGPGLVVGQVQVGPGC